MKPAPSQPVQAEPTDAAIMAIAGQWFVTGENLRKPDGYYYRSLGTPSNVRGSDLIEFARALYTAPPARDPAWVQAWVLVPNVEDDYEPMAPPTHVNEDELRKAVAQLPKT